ncbi:MAG: outer membrane protein assembly factor BamB, contains PQQ-like beta-propeller repeat [Nocardioides sp.]|nr:outer membrane protein assembly factor BamB, contains PQQ-like beta-propeller repeat [Nocardioides sp.]
MTSRARRGAAWLPPLVLVPAVMAGLVHVAEPSPEDDELALLQPLELGTTWVYDVRAGDEPSGTRTKQITGPAGLNAEALDAVKLQSSYTDYPGRGPTSNTVDLNLSDDGQQLLQYGLQQQAQHFAVEPPAASFELPLEVGATWSFNGLVGSLTLDSTSEILDITDLEVGGRTFTDCVHTESRQTVTAPDEEPSDEPADVEVVEEWSCPGYGAVRTVLDLPGQKLITEELVEFHGAADSWYAERPPAVDADPGPGSQAGFDPGRTRAVLEGRLEPTLAWSDTPAVDLGWAPVSDDEVAVLVEEDGQVTVREHASGAIRWRVRLEGPILATAAMAGDRVLVADGTKNLWALDLADGAARWVHHFGDIVSTEPAVDGSLALVASDDGLMTAIDLASGAVEWTEDLGVRLTTAPAVDTGALVVADPAGSVFALDLDDGSELWRQDLGSGLTAGPLARDGRVVVADDAGSVYALDGGGTIVWEAISRDLPTHLALGEDEVVLLGDDDHLESYALEDGDLRWQRDLPTTVVAPAIVGEQVITVSKAGRVSVRDLDDGAEDTGWDLPRGVSGDLLCDLDLGLVNGSLVIGADTEAVGQETTLFAYPTTAEAATGGVWFRVSTRDLPASPSFGSDMSGSTLFTPSGESLLRSTTDGTVETVVEGPGVGLGVSVDDDLVVVQKGEEYLAYGPDGGDPLWTHPATTPTPYTQPAIGENAVFLPLVGAGIVGVSRDGKPMWVQQVPGDMGGTSPVALPVGDVVYGGGGLARYDGRTGEPVWKAADGQTLGALAYDDGTVFGQVFRIADTSGIGAVDAETGQVRWVVESPLGELGPAADDGVVVHGDQSGLVLALDADTGAELWRLQLSSALAGRPVVVGDRTYVAEQGRTHDLYQREYRISVHDTRTGAFLGAFAPPSHGYTLTPSFSATRDGRLLVPATIFGSAMMILEPRP